MEKILLYHIDNMCCLFVVISCVLYGYGSLKNTVSCCCNIPSGTPVLMITNSAAIYGHTTIITFVLRWRGVGQGRVDIQTYTKGDSGFLVLQLAIHKQQQRQTLSIQLPCNWGHPWTGPWRTSWMETRWVRHMMWEWKVPTFSLHVRPTVISIHQLKQTWM